MGFVIPEHAVTHFHLRPGDRAGDFGAGSGHFTRALADVVGPEGKVFALEIQRELVERLTTAARTEGLRNIEVLWGDLEASGGVRLADGSLDAIVLSNTLFQIQDRDAAFAEIARILRTGGKLFVIDWTESFGGMGPEQGAVVDEHAARELAKRHGFSFERSFPAGEHHYGLALRKA